MNRIRTVANDHRIPRPISVMRPISFGAIWWNLSLFHLYFATKQHGKTCVHDLFDTTPRKQRLTAHQLSGATLLGNSFHSFQYSDEQKNFLLRRYGFNTSICEQNTDLIDSNTWAPCQSKTLAAVRCWPKFFCSITVFCNVVQSIYLWAKRSLSFSPKWWFESHWNSPLNRLTFKLTYLLIYFRN